MARVSLLLVLIAVAAAVSAVELFPKQLNGPPSEFARHGIPDATKGALYRDSALFFVKYQASATNANQLVFTQDLAVDSTTAFRLVVRTSLDDVATVAVTAPDGSAFDLDAYASNSMWPIGDQIINTTVYEVPNPVTGVYQLTLTVDGMSEDDLRAFVADKPRGTTHQGLVILQNDAPEEIYSHLSTYKSSMCQSDDLTILARMYDASANPKLSGVNKGLAPTPLRESVTSAELEIIYPDGSIHEVAMHDDGLHSDGEADDGVFGGDFVPADKGYYLVQSVFRGTNDAGAPYVRTAEHQVKIVANDIRLASTYTTELHTSAPRVVFKVPVSNADGSPVDTSAGYRAYAQVWGKHLFSSQQTATAWTSALVYPQQATDGSYYVPLEMDLKWALKAGTTYPFTLQDVYLQEVNTMVPVATMDTMTLDSYDRSVHVGVSRALFGLNRTYAGEEDEAMRFGIRPAHLQRTNLTDSTRRLVLLHGYCADGNPWQKQSEDWPADALYFNDAKQSRSHDEFAQLVQQFVADSGVDSYALIGHSQGGIVTMHTLNYYWTGLDLAPDGVRKTQSLASPYQGNTGAGGWAELLGSLGGCGENQDLTRDGAELWLAGLSAAAVSQQFFYTTQYGPGGLFGDGYCNKLVNTVLKKPNDGATESEYAPLEGATHVDNFVGQCHIPDMNWPASFWDKDRNAEMRAAAGF